MTTVAVIAHRDKHLGGGLVALRERLATEGIDAPLWFEVNKSRKAPKRARQALVQGADRVLVWGGDGMVQRCIDVLAGTGATIGILPAGTANLFATNLGIPRDFDRAVDVALHGALRELDVGVVNGERFAVMAGTGFDAEMIKDADGGLKDAKPDDGYLDIGVVLAKSRWQWSKVIALMLAGKPTHSKLVKVTRGQNAEVRLERKAPYELDGGARKATRRLDISIKPRAITVCVPAQP
jgi:diacylglycerol kinase family enzyme